MKSVEICIYGIVFVLFCFSNLSVVFVTWIIIFWFFFLQTRHVRERYSDVVFHVFVCHKNNIFQNKMYFLLYLITRTSVPCEITIGLVVCNFGIHLNLSVQTSTLAHPGGRGGFKFFNFHAVFGKKKIAK